MSNHPADGAHGEPAQNLIVVCPDGPILVRGDFEVVSTSGEPVARNRRTVALCRCGASTIKPYCDGTHKLIGFRTTEGSFQPPAP
jgi:CDGSH-type Zn-finger protein